MSKRRPYLITSALAACLLATGPAATAADDAEEQVRCSEIAFSLSLQNKDDDAFAALIDEDARFMGNGFRVTHGRQNIAEAWSGLLAADAPEMIWRPQVVQVLESGDLGFSRGPYRVRGTLKDGEEYEDWGIFNSVWRKGDDGRWTVVFDAGFVASKPLSEESRALIEDPAPACATTDS